MTQYLISFAAHAMDHIPEEEGAAKVAAACRCAHEVRVFQPGPDV
jgi:hypothetical protein